MAITVHLPGALAQDVGGARELALECPGSATLDDVLKRIRVEYPALGRRVCDETGSIRRFVNVYVDEAESRELQGLRTTVPDGSTILIVGSVAGG